MTESGIPGAPAPVPPLPSDATLETAPEVPEVLEATDGAAADAGDAVPAAIPVDLEREAGVVAGEQSSAGPAWHRRPWLRWTGAAVGAAAVGAVATGLVFGLALMPAAERRAAETADAAGYARGHAEGLTTGEENGKQAALEEQAQREQEARDAAQKEIDDAKGALELGSLLCVNDRLELASDKASVDVDSKNGKDSKGVEAVGCMLGVLDAPDSVASKMEGTRALDGVVEAEWDHYKATWRFHPDDGLDVLFEFVG